MKTYLREISSVRNWILQSSPNTPNLNSFVCQAITKQLDQFAPGYGLKLILVPLMKKAGAIVTDEGGITSHAAVISREMGKPCIIGTRNATKVFKDGDLVEVDANKGYVKILKKARMRR